MRKFRIIRITEFKVEADFEDEAIEKCRNNKADSEQTRYVRFKNNMGEQDMEGKMEGNYIQEELDRLHKKVDGLKKDQDFKGVEVWTVESDNPIELDISKKEQRKEFERLKQAINKKQKIIQVKNFCIVIDKITSFKAHFI